MVECLKACVNCEYFVEWEKEPKYDYGDCRRNPPVLDQDDCSRFPAVRILDWCGEFALAQGRDLKKTVEEARGEHEL